MKQSPLRLCPPRWMWFVAIFFSGMMQPMTEKKHPLSRSGSYMPDVFYDDEDGAECSGKILQTRTFIFLKKNSKGQSEGYRACKSLDSSSDYNGRRFKDAQGKVFMLYNVKCLESNNQ